MTSLHRKFPVLLSTDGDQAWEVRSTRTTMSLHFTTARPFEIRLRLPQTAVAEIVKATTTPDPRQYLAWSFDRLTLKAALCMTPGIRWGIGNVCIGRHAIGQLLVGVKRTGLPEMVASTPIRHPDGATPVNDFVDGVDRLFPMPPESAPVQPFVDECIERLLASSS